MKAIVADRYGPPEVLQLREVPKPVPGEREILVRVSASVATPPDCAFRSARPFIVRFFAGLFRPKHKVIGTTLAGEVEAVGRAVTRFRPGDRVYGAPEYGAYAEYACLAEDAVLARTPASLSDAEAAGLSEGLLTALPFLRDHAKLQPGQRILVNGASGSIGTVAVQLARHIGADVTAVCSARNRELVLGLGAHRVIDYAQEDFTRGADRWDVVFDAVGKSSFRRSRRVLGERGVYMTTVPSFGILLVMLRAGRGRGRRGLLATTGLRKNPDKLRDLDRLAELVAAGALRAVIDRTYPLAETAAAHRYVETGRKRGSVVLAIGPQPGPRREPCRRTGIARRGAIR